MSSINWQDFKCRCSAISQMLSESKSCAPLTEKQVARVAELEGKEKITENMKLELSDLLLKKENSKKVVLSDTCIGYLMEEYAWRTQRMVSVTKEMDIQQLNKGKIQEPEGIALLSIVDGVEYSKYEGDRISNDYLSGLPDIFKGEEIMKATKIIDLKNSWDYIGFLKKIDAPINIDNKLQVQGYMDITGAKEGEIADVLTDMPEIIINDYRRKLMYRMGVATDQAPEYLEAVKIMERSMYFEGKIPRHKRVFKKYITPFTDFDRQRVYDKVKICRDWLYKFDEMYNKLNK